MSYQSLEAAVEALLAKDRREHARAVEWLGNNGDRRVIPHLLEVATLDAVANDWETFGFPEVLRQEPPPRSLALPEVAWPGATEAMGRIAEPDYDSPAAWLQWESWVTRQGIDPLDGFGDWKVRLFRSFHPMVGHLLDTPGLDAATVRWGNTDPASLHPINGATFTTDTDYLRDDDLVFGFEAGDRAYAVPRYLIFPHELLNATVGGVPLSVTYCTMCNSPICYDRRAAGRTLTFGSTGCIRGGNKLMYDEETLTLWSQHRGTPVAGTLASDDGRGDADADPGERYELDFLPITQANWVEWRADNPDTMALDPDTGYDYDYEYYREYEGFISQHYWHNPEVTHPGVAPGDGPLDDKTHVYGVETENGVRVYPVENVDGGVAYDAGADPPLVVVGAEDAVAYRAPPAPVVFDPETKTLTDGQGRAWAVELDGLRSGDRTLDRIPGRHGLWMAFRVGYDEDDLTVVDPRDGSGG